MNVAGLLQKYKYYILGVSTGVLLLFIYLYTCVRTCRCIYIILEKLIVLISRIEVVEIGPPALCRAPTRKGCPS